MLVVEAYAQDAVVLGDRDALEQAVLILVDNAVKYTPGGGRIAVSTAVHDGRIELAVEDSGPGVPANLLPRLGERFFRVDKARSREMGGGAGLGLSIARRIVAAHGGSLDIRSAPGAGTTVTVSLTAARR